MKNLRGTKGEQDRIENNQSAFELTPKSNISKLLRNKAFIVIK